MKKKLFILFLFFLIISHAYALFTDADKAQITIDNLFTNGAAEQGLVGWSETGGGTLALETTTIRSGKSSIKFTASATNDYLNFPSVIIKKGTNNCEITIWYKTTSLVWDLEIYYGTDKIALLDLPANTEFNKASLNFVCSNIASAYTTKITNGAASDVIFVDDSYIGEARNIGSINLLDKEYDISSYVTGATSVQGATARVKKDRDGGYRLEGNVQVTYGSGATTKNFAITGVTTASGYNQTFTVGADASDQGYGGYIGASSNTFYMTAVSSRSVWQASFTLKLASIPTWATDFSVTQVIKAEVANQSGSTIWSYPNANSNIVTATSATSLNISGGDTYRLNKGAATTQSTAGDIALTIPSLLPGSYLVLFNGDLATTGSTLNRCLFGISDGTNTYMNSIEFANNANVFLNHAMAYFEYSSIGNRTFTLKAANYSGGQGCFINMSEDSSQTITLTVIPLTPKVSMSQIVNSVGTIYDGQVRTERSILNCDSSSAITSQLGSWISSIGNISTGVCTVTLTAGVFNTTPKCQCHDQSSTVDSITKGNATSTTSVSIVGTKPSDGSALSAFDCLLECYEGR